MKKFALITGASSGIGKVFAEKLASEKRNLILVSRNEDKLHTLAVNLRRRYSIEAEIISADLGTARGADYVFKTCTDNKWDVDLLVNNAGFGLTGAVLDQDPARLEEMLTLNMTSVAKMCRLFLPQMVERKAGAIINVASTAAFQPVPGFATYSATKTFVLYYSEALAAEVARHGVQVTTLCPGPTETNFFEVAGFSGFKIPMQAPEIPVKAALDGVRAKRTVVIPGWTNKVLANFGHYTPHKLITNVAARFMN